MIISSAPRTETPIAVVLGCVSQLPHGRHQLATLRAEARHLGVRLVGADSAERLEQAKASGGDASLASLETIAVPLEDAQGCA